GPDIKTGVDQISGGIISIVSICEETVRIKNIHHSEVIMCTLPGEPLLLKHTQFKNKTTVFRFEQLTGYFKKLRSLQLHLPEFVCGYFLEQVKKGDWQWMQSLPDLRINIINQNIQLMPEQGVIDQLKASCKELTITTAHSRYCTKHYRQVYG